ncbi:MAG: hypothetical protein RAO94_10815 [Candidatus Stygibacter australis]|nr:hypothetical protein [Candidatus Stygibacter australis]
MKFLKICIIIMLNLCLVDLSAAGLLLPWSAKSAASNCCGYISGDSGAIFSYPSLGGTGIYFSNTRMYNLAELPRYILAAGTEWQDFTLGYAIDHLHHPFYKETNQLINLGYGNENFRAGINIRNLLIDISEEPIEGAFLFDLGMSWQLETLSSAVSWLNVGAGTIEEETIPIYFVWEANWQAVTDGNLAIRIEKETGFEFHPTLAGDYSVSRSFRLISSYSFYPGSLGCGFEIIIGKIAVSYGLQYHEDLQESHYLSLQYTAVN